MRKLSGTQDTDDESADFVTPDATSSPEHRLSLPITIDCATVSGISAYTPR